MRFELTTSTLARLRSTPELRPLTMGSPAEPEAVIKRISRFDARGKSPSTVKNLHLTTLRRGNLRNVDQ